MNEDGSPGRLFFNDRLLPIRSDEERIVLELLRNAEFRQVEVEDLRQLSQLSSVDPKDLRAVRTESDDQNLRRYRNSVVSFVESDGYVKLARTGLIALHAESEPATSEVAGQNAGGQ